VTQLLFFGHACFAIKGKDFIVLIDPYLKGNPHLSSFPQDLTPNLILITHGHYDHLGDAIEIAKEKNATILAQPEIVNYCQKMGVKQTIKLHYGGRIALDFGSVKMVPAWHSSSISEEGLYGGNPCGYVINFLGHIFYHAGDTALFGDMKIIGESDPVEVAMLPIGDRYTMGIDDAAKAVSFIKPKIVIPMHFNTFDVIIQNPEEFRRLVELNTTARCIILKPGGCLELT